MRIETMRQIVQSLKCRIAELLLAWLGSAYSFIDKTHKDQYLMLSHTYRT